MDNFLKCDVIWKDVKYVSSLIYQIGGPAGGYSKGGEM